MKRKQIDLRYKKLNWLLGRKSHVSVDNSCSQIHNCTYMDMRHTTMGLCLPVKNYKSNCWRPMVRNQWWFPNVQVVIHVRSIKHRTNLESHTNPLLQPLPRDVIRRLQWRWPADLWYGQWDLLAGGDLITLVCLQASTTLYHLQTSIGPGSLLWP